VAENYYGQLVLPGDVGPESPPAISQELMLGDIRDRLANHPFVLALDDHGSIAGVVPRNRILERLQVSNPHERRRWEMMPLRSLIDAGISRQSSGIPADFSQPIDCSLIADDRELIGITIEDDVYLSWRKLEPMLLAASCDPLTGLFNRQTYERRLNEEWARASRTGTSVAVVVVDLDRFKPINDCYGHQAGDAILNQVARVLESSLRSYDIVARYGGDEFVAICLGCSSGEIQLPIQRIQQQMRINNFDFNGTSLPVTASIGAAVQLENFENSNPQDLFAAADECLYTAKTSIQAGYFVEFGIDSRQPQGVDHFLNTTSEPELIKTNPLSSESIDIEVETIVD